jgi:hypothetical protein
MATGILASFFDEIKNLRLGYEKQVTWLASFWVLFPLLALGAWSFGPKIGELNAKLDRLALGRIF